MKRSLRRKNRKPGSVRYAQEICQLLHDFLTAPEPALPAEKTTSKPIDDEPEMLSLF